jgi:hypothetical protein
MMATWQEMAHSVFTRAESVGGYLIQGLTALRDGDMLKALVAAEPKLAPLAEKLAAVIPGIGTTIAVVDLLDFGVEHWATIQYIGAVAHFAPADALNYVPFKEDTGDTGFTSRE